MPPSPSHLAVLETRLVVKLGILRRLPVFFLLHAAQHVLDLELQRAKVLALLFRVWNSGFGVAVMKLSVLAAERLILIS